MCLSTPSPEPSQTWTQPHSPYIHNQLSPLHLTCFPLLSRSVTHHVLDWLTTRGMEPTRPALKLEDDGPWVRPWKTVRSGRCWTGQHHGPCADRSPVISSHWVVSPRTLPTLFIIASSSPSAALSGLRNKWPQLLSHLSRVIPSRSPCALFLTHSCPRYTCERWRCVRRVRQHQRQGS